MLKKYGGIWVDATTFMTNPLQELLGDNPNVRTFFALPYPWTDQSLKDNDSRLHQQSWESGFCQGDWETSFGKSLPSDMKAQAPGLQSCEPICSAHTGHSSELDRSSSELVPGSSFWRPLHPSAAAVCVAVHGRGDTAAKQPMGVKISESLKPETRIKSGR